MTNEAEQVVSRHPKVGWSFEINLLYKLAQQQQQQKSYDTQTTKNLANSLKIDC